jgi:hypothetical protein
LKKIQMYEQYHVACLLFFSFSAFIGIYNHDFIYTVLAVSANIVYNVIPLLIQQYNRIRLSECAEISKMINHIQEHENTENDNPTSIHVATVSHENKHGR